jgi:alkanesulfonate monooxygenase SsuD/methylene tetrahydromethanopterin reductase-like flavin-dependent oxidoreductase (luciferase family)
MADEIEEARLPIKQELALYIACMGARDKNFYNDYAKRLGYEAEAIRIQDAFLGGRKTEAAAAVPDALVDEIALVGSADRIRDRLAAWKDAGKRRHVDSMLLRGNTTVEALRLIAEAVL